jgi:mitochondrial fission protein ELM1
VARKFSTCWVVTDGNAGQESQSVGLAEALGLAPIIKRVRLRSPWKEMSPWLRVGSAHAFRSDSDKLEPPWPDVLIGSGRQSVPASLYVRDQSKRDDRPTFTIQMQNPVISPSNFGLVIAPLHDRLSGPNVISTLGALHRVTPERIAQDAEAFAPKVAHLPRPYVGVLIGGPNAAYRFTASDMRAFSDALRRVAKETPASLLITPSRRTGEENTKILRETLADVPAFIWDGNGDNPYFAFLGLADNLIVTPDSVNMISEACASGKPVQIYDLPGGSKKSARFLEAIRERGLVRNFEGRLENFAAPVVNEMATVVAALRRLS